MKVYYDIKDMLEKELEQIADKRELTSNNLEVMSKAVDIIKDIDIICGMKREEEEGYSEMMPYHMYDDGSSYARGRGRYAKRDSMGRYSSEGGYSGRGSYDGGSYDSYNRGSSYDSYERGGRRGGYSREDSKEHMVSELERMEQSATDEKQRSMIRNWKNQLQNA